MRHPLLLALCCCLALTLPATAAATDPELQRWLDGAQRSAKNRARDTARQPAATLAFFGLQPTSTVVEVWPSVGAWWFEILAPYLRERGRYIAALHAGAHNPPAARAEHEVIEGRIAGQPELYGRVVVAHSPGLSGTVPDNSVDLLLTFMNLHNWVTDGEAEDIVREFFRVLKPGGTLGVVDHRADPERPAAEQLKAGYLREADVIRLIENAGFTLVARSDIAANPRDSKDYAAGVWALPPSLRPSAEDPACLRAIGESDKFTLKFSKPLP